MTNVYQIVNAHVIDESITFQTGQECIHKAGSAEAALSKMRAERTEIVLAELLNLCRAGAAADEIEARICKLIMVFEELQEPD